MKSIINSLNLLYTRYRSVHIVSLLLLLLMLSSCEEVVEVDLESGAPRLVVDAEILWEKGTDGQLQTIELSRITDYYNPSPTRVSEASVFIENSEGAVFNFTESEEAGVYVCTDFVPQLEETYTLEVMVEDQFYTATETLISVPEISRIEQDKEGGFFGEDIEISFYYTDPADEQNFYLTDFRTDFLFFPSYSITDDDFYNGNEILESFADEDLEVGDTVNVRHRGISQQFYNYMQLILETTSGNPFGTPPSNIRGNIINQSQPDDFAVGYFRLSEMNSFSHTVEDE